MSSLSVSDTPLDMGHGTYTILYHHRTKSLDGQRVHIYAIQDALRADGHRVVEVSVLKATEMAGAVPSAGWRRRLLERLQSAMPPWAHEVLEYFYNPVGCVALVRAAWRHRPHFIYERYALNTVAGVWAARLLGLPLLLEVNSPLATERDQLTRRWFAGVAHAIERQVLRRATRVLAVTQVLAGIIIADAQLDPATVEVIHNGVNLQRFDGLHQQRAALRAQIGAGGRVVVGAVAFFRPWHGIDQLLRVVARNSDLRSKVLVLLVGEGPALSDLQQFISTQSLTDVVRCTGAVPHDKIPALLSAIDIAVLPRATGYASPLKLLEYMAAGKAILAPRQDNVLEVASDGREVMCFTPDEENELEQHLVRLVAGDVDRQLLGEAARARLIRDDRTWQGNARRIVRAFERATACRASSLAPGRPGAPAPPAEPGSHPARM